MKKSEMSVGQTVVFGWGPGIGGGKKTKGVVIKLNPVNAKIAIIEKRNRSEVGAIFNAPYVLIDSAIAVAKPKTIKSTRNVARIAA